MDCLRTYFVFFVVIFIFKCSIPVVECGITDVSLIGGPVPSKGTVEIKLDNGEWETTCGTNLGINDVIVICKQLGFTGASRALNNTSFGQNSMPSLGLHCDGDEAELSECRTFSLPSCSTAGGASCYGERYLGCFVDNTTNRVLQGEKLVKAPWMTSLWMNISRCIQFCNDSTNANYVYAGVEHGDECYCGEASDNYARLGVGTDVNCQIPCSGEPTDSCGGVGYIAVFSISAISVTTATSPVFMVTSSAHVPSSAAPEVSSTDMMRSTGSTSTPSQMSTTPEDAPPPFPRRGNDAGLYGGIGGGVGVLIIVIIVITFVISRRSRHERKDNNSQRETLANSSRPTGNNGISNTAMGETSTAGVSPRKSMNDYECMPNDAQGYDSRPYDSADNFSPMDVKRDKKSRLSVAYAMPNKNGTTYDGIAGDVDMEPYASVTNFGAGDVPAMPKKKDRVSAVYAMPDKNGTGSGNAYEGIADDVQRHGMKPPSSVKSSGAGDARAVPKKNDRLSVVYAMPDKNGNGTGGDGSVDFGSLYAMPDKARGEPDGYDGDSSQGLYAMPNKSLSGDQYESGMIENELYSM